MQSLLQYLTHYHPLSEELQLRLANYIYPENHPKGTILLHHQAICDSIYYIKKGFARGFRDFQGRTVTTWFWKEEDLVTSMESFIQQKPTIEGIELLEDCQLLVLSYEHLQTLYQDFVEFNVIGRLLIEQYFIKAGEMTYALRNLTAREKYDYLLELHPDIFQRTTLQNIASYLGLSPETISRLRQPR